MKEELEYFPLNKRQALDEDGESINHTPAYTAGVDLKHFNSFNVITISEGQVDHRDIFPASTQIDPELIINASLSSGNTVSNRFSGNLVHDDDAIDHVESSILGDQDRPLVSNRSQLRVFREAGVQSSDIGQFGTNTNPNHHQQSTFFQRCLITVFPRTQYRGSTLVTLCPLFHAGRNLR
jgi:hypothetical protein